MNLSVMGEFRSIGGLEQYVRDCFEEMRGRVIDGLGVIAVIQKCTSCLPVCSIDPIVVEVIDHLAFVCSTRGNTRESQAPVCDENSE